MKKSKIKIEYEPPVLSTLKYNLDKETAKKNELKEIIRNIKTFIKSLEETKTKKKKAALQDAGIDGLAVLRKRVKRDGKDMQEIKSFEEGLLTIWVGGNFFTRGEFHKIDPAVRTNMLKHEFVMRKRKELHQHHLDFEYYALTRKGENIVNLILEDENELSKYVGLFKKFKKQVMK